MNDNPQQSVVPIRSPWRTLLLDAVTGCKQRLLMVCPYIKEEVVTAMQQALLTGVRQQQLAIRIITRVNPDDLLSGSSDIAALQQLLRWPDDLPDCTLEMRAIPNVHAKVWVCDTQLAIVGSGNATPSGLDENLEYGLAISDQVLIERILSDWQPWWEQAERVEQQALVAIAQRLEEIRQSDSMRQSQTQNEIIRQQLRTTPRLGKRISFKKEPRQFASPLMKEQPARLAATAPDVIEVIAPAAAAVLGNSATIISDREAINVPARDFWHALCWVLPFEEEIDGMIDSNAYPGAYVKLAWRVIAADRQELHLIWADGKRYSQAALTVHNAVLQQPWAITMNVEQIYLLGRTLQSLKEAGCFTSSVEQHFHLLLQAEQASRLSIAYLRDPANPQSGETIVLPCTLASIPGNFPILRPPISHITVSHQRLRDALIALRNEWQTTHTPSEKLAIIELSFGEPDTRASLRLSTGQIAAPAIRIVEGTDGVIAGSPVTLRLDYQALRQVLIGSQDMVESWQLCVGRNADTIQCIPERAILPNATLLWRHELRGL